MTKSTHSLVPASEENMEKEERQPQKPIPTLTGLCCGGVAQSCPTLTTTWTVALQAPLFTGFPWREYWSGLPFPSPGDLSDSGIEPGCPALQADSLPLSYQGRMM